MKPILLFLSLIIASLLLSENSFSKDPVIPTLGKDSSPVVKQVKQVNPFTSQELINMKNKNDKAGMIKFLKQFEATISPTPSVLPLSKCTAPYEYVEYTSTGGPLDENVQYGCQLPDSEWSRLSCPWGYGPDFMRPSQYYCNSDAESPWSWMNVINLYVTAECSSGYHLESFWQANYGGQLYAHFECQMENINIDYDDVCGSPLLGMTSNSAIDETDGRRTYLCEPK